MHSKARRSISDNNLVHVEFKAHSQFFRLRLKRDLRVFGDSLEVHDEKGKIDVDTDHIYQGHLLGKFHTDRTEFIKESNPITFQDKVWAFGKKGKIINGIVNINMYTVSQIE